jgi:hypothetical protein
VTCVWCGASQGVCCRENHIRREDHLAACKRVDERDAEVAALKAKLRDIKRRMNWVHRMCAENGMGCMTCADVAVGIETPLPKRRRAR